MTTRRQFLHALTTLMVAAPTVAKNTSSLRVPRFRSNPFTLGVASGYPTQRSVVLWTRLAPVPLAPGGGMDPYVVPVTWELATDERMKKVVQKGEVYATPEWAHSVHVEPIDLEPARDYWYRFTVGDARSPIGRTRTAPQAGAPTARLRMAVASCQHYEQGYFTAYRSMVADNPDLVVHVGDYIYEANVVQNPIRRHNLPEAYTLEDYRARYALYKSDPDLAAAHAACPWLVTWDDHEVDNDYGGEVSEDARVRELVLARRAAAYRAYYEHMPLPRSAVPFGPHMRLYEQRAFGDLVSICMLDQRQYRSPQACGWPTKPAGNRVRDCAEIDAPTRTMLGLPQENWLGDRLASSRARWNLLAQGTPMAYLDEDPGPSKAFWSDSWNGYGAARERVMAMIEGTQVPNPVVLTGDIHAFLAAELRRKPDDPESPVVASELITTSISSRGIPQALLDAWRSINPGILVANSEHRGYLRLDITPEVLAADMVSVDATASRGGEKGVESGATVFQSLVIEASRPGPQAT